MERIKQATEFTIIITILVLGMLGIVFSVKAYPETFQTQASLESENEMVDPDRNIAINFSEPMIPESVESGITINPEVVVSYGWENSNKKLIIIPKENWNPETEYQIKISNSRNVMFMEFNAELSFTTSPYPQVKSFLPENGAKDVIIDIEDPIKISFDKPLDNFQIKLSTSPKELLVYQMDEGSSSLEILPKSSFNDGKQYNIEVFVKHKNENDDGYRKIYATSFETIPPPLKLTTNGQENRLTYAKKQHDPEVDDGKYIDIDISDQTMVIFEDGKALDAFLVSSGKDGMDTPQGDFKIHNKYPRPFSRRYEVFMPYWMAIEGTGAYGIHELPEWPNGHKEGESHLGIPVSHGCVRLGIGAAKMVYEWAEIGTPIKIHE